MVAYRFCRPDDIPLLVAAVNRCYDVHFPEAPPLGVDGFRREMRELQLWPSNCMLASAGEEPAAVMVGTKRSREVLVSRLGVAPSYQLRGHGRHLVESLAQKLAVLGPPRLVAEVPAALPQAQAFFAAVGWRQEVALRDFVRPGPAARQPRVAVAGGAVPPPGAAPRPRSRSGIAPAGIGAAAAVLDEVAAVSVDVATLDGAGLLPARADLAWERQPEALRGAGAALRGVALVAGGSMLGWALFRPTTIGADLLAVGFPGSDPEALLDALCEAVAQQVPGPLRLPRLLPGELPEAALRAARFVPRDAYARVTTTVAPP